MPKHVKVKRYTKAQLAEIDKMMKADNNEDGDNFPRHRKPPPVKRGDFVEIHYFDVRWSESQGKSQVRVCRDCRNCVVAKHAPRYEDAAMGWHFEIKGADWSEVAAWDPYYEIWHAI